MRRNLKRPGSLAIRFLLVLSTAGLALTASYAHQQKMAVTRILFNANSGNIEVMHRFYIHDAEHAATLIFGERQALIESAESRELFSSYVMNRFAIEASFVGGARRELALEYIGEEIDGQFLWVYQEAPLTAAIHSLAIVNMALRDVWPEQSNLVNIEREDEIISLSFEGAADMLSAELRALP